MSNTIPALLHVREEEETIMNINQRREIVNTYLDTLPKSELIERINLYLNEEQLREILWESANAVNCIYDDDGLGEEREPATQSCWGNK